MSIVVRENHKRNLLLGENQEMLTFKDANEAHRWAQAHLPAAKWGILKVKLHPTR